MAERVTIADVARRCGLSKSTVSKALNLPESESPLSPETRRRVFDTARTLGYRPDWRAVALSKSRTQTIGLLCSRNTSPLTGVYEEIFDSMAEVLAARHYQLLNIFGGMPEEEYAQILSSGRLDGCLAFETLGDRAAGLLEEARLPSVLVNAKTERALPQILLNDYRGAQLATRHLISLGHRRIVFFHGTEAVEHYSIGDRIAGYRDAMTQAGLEDGIEIANQTIEEFTAERMLSATRPSAVVCYIHYFAIDLLGELARHGLSVPDDVSIVTFNDVYPLGRLRPGITTMKLPSAGIGRMAVKLLLDQIEGRELERRVVTFDETLLLRESTRKFNG